MVRWGIRACVACALFLAMSLPGAAQAAPGPRWLSAGSQGVVCQELVTNGGFEEGATGWQESSPGLIDTTYPYSGTYSAELGGALGSDDQITQVITLPVSSPSLTLTLSFWWSVLADVTDTVHDKLTVSVAPAGQAPIGLDTLDNTFPNSIWMTDTLNLLPYAGQTVAVSFEGSDDDVDAATFFVDDVSISACSSPIEVYLPLTIR
jgi:hypothetical protein